MVQLENVPLAITRHTFVVGGPTLTDPQDAYIYLVDLKDTLVLIDAGIGRTVERLLQNISKLGLNPKRIEYLVLTHSHVDHSGGAAALRTQLKCQVVAHEKAAHAVTQGDPTATAGNYYGITPIPCPIDITLASDAGSISSKTESLRYLYTPGHTPGSIVLYFDDSGRRVLFGQDLHGPFNAAWGSDIVQWRTSMQLVLALEADILCEGHYGVYRGKSAVRQFINGLLNRLT